MSGIASLADVQAIEQRSDLQLPSSTYEMIRAAAIAQPDAPALSFFLRAEDHERPETWSYRALFEAITASANFFHRLGIDADDVIAFVLPNLPETQFTIWGGEAAGIVQAINPMLEAPAIVELLNAAGAKALVTLAPFPGTDLWAKLQPVLDQVPSLAHVVLVNLAAHLRSAHGTAASPESQGCGVAAKLRPAVPARIALHDFAQGIAAEPVDRLVSGRRIRPEDFSSFFCTGGTTGTPKIAMRTHANEVANAWSTGQLLGDGMGADKNIFCGLPLFHVNAVLVTGLVPFSRGAHVILGTPLGYRGDGVVARFWELVEHHRINFFSAVPTLYASLLQQPIGERDVSTLEYGLCGAAPMPTELLRTFQQKTGLRILEGYGLTEGTCVSSCNPPLGEHRIGSIGLRVPLQQMKAVVLGDNGGYLRDCAPGEVGVIVISGPNVFAGYRAAEHNRGIWVHTGDGRRWLNTGDLGRQDDDGYFYLTGRKKELIIRGGHNIDPASIEEPLHRHPAVQLAAAVGRPDAHAGELPVAYVQLKAGATTTEAELMEFAKAHIAERAAVPKRIHLIAAMPLTGVGKIFKPALRQREIESALREALCECGLQPAAVHAAERPGEGVGVEVLLTEAAELPRAQEALGPFPFRCRIEIATALAPA